MGPQDARAAPTSTPQRTATVSERIANRLKDLRNKSASTLDAQDTPDETVFEAPTSEGDKSPPNRVASPMPLKVDKGKGRAVEADEPPRTMMMSPPPMDALPPPQVKIEVSAPLIILANVSFQPAQLSALLARAKAELPLRAVRFPLLGEYQE